MEALMLSEICNLLNVENPIEDCQIKKIAHIKRNVEKGCLFFAFKTWRIDTYSNIEVAIEKGAVAIVTDKYIDDYPCIVVDNPQEAFFKIASYVRDRHVYEAIAVTGSVGKTSTKEMIYNAISKSVVTECSKENSNSSDLVAMDIFDFPQDISAVVHEIAIQDIHYSSMVFKPTIAVITNIGYSHIEAFGTIENIRDEKIKVFDGLSKDGLKVLNADDAILFDYYKDKDKKNILFYGMTNKQADIKACDITYEDSGYSFTIDYFGDKYSARINCDGIHNILNALAAFGIGIYMGIDAKALISGIAEFKPHGYRQNKIEVEGVTILADCFNAAPLSVKNALDTIEAMNVDEGCKKIVVLGDMLEMGVYSLDVHREICNYINSKNIDKVVLYGDEYIKVSDELKNNHIDKKCFYRKNDLVEYLKKNANSKGDVVLFKGSHGMELEEVIDDVYKTNLHDEFYKSAYFVGRIIREKISIKDYFDKKEIKTVAFWGVLPETEEIIDFFIENGIEVEYAIDRKAKYIPEGIYSVNLVTIEDIPKKVDCVILTMRNINDYYKMSLEKTIDMPLITLKELSQDLFEI